MTVTMTMSAKLIGCTSRVQLVPLMSEPAPDASAGRSGTVS
jgi:hypothetical protein